MVYITNPYLKKKHIAEVVLMPNSVKSSRPSVTVGGCYEEVKESKEDKIKKRNTTCINVAPPKHKEKPSGPLDKTIEEKLKKFISLKIL